MASTGPSRRATYFKHEADKLIAVEELIVSGSALKSTSWSVGTRGEASDLKCESAQQARVEYERQGQRKLAEGFHLVQEGEFTPGKVNFGLLLSEIRDGARSGFSAVRQKHPNENVNAFALMGYSCGEGPACVANSAEAHKRTYEKYGGADHYDYCLWSPNEWQYWDDEHSMWLPSSRTDAEWFDAPEALKDDRLRGEYVEKSWETCIRALEQLDREGFFGVGKDREQVIVMFEVHDSGGPLDKDIERLNPPSVYRRYREHMSKFE